MSKELWTDERINAMKTPDARSVALKMRHEYEQRIVELEAKLKGRITELTAEKKRLRAKRRAQTGKLAAENEQLRAENARLRAMLPSEVSQRAIRLLANELRPKDMDVHGPDILAWLDSLEGEVSDGG